MDAVRVRAKELVEALCSVDVDRRPGSHGNDQAVTVVSESLRDAGWDVATPEFACLDWRAGEAILDVGGKVISLTPSPYGLGVDATGPVRVLSTIGDVRGRDIDGSIAVLAGELASEPVTPKAFPFYGSDEHTQLIDALETAGPVAVIGVTGKYPELCGALDPFPLFEDGDFQIPAASIRPADATHLLESEGQMARVRIDAIRIPSTARNVVARRGSTAQRLTVCAHIDTKPGTPGAVDNAAGVAVLVMLSEVLSHHDELPIGVELLAVNGEDHFAAPGELAWLDANDGQLDEIELFINIDGAGYREGGTSFSLYNVVAGTASTIRDVLVGYDDLAEGPQWFQSDHAVLAMLGRPALAFTTERLDHLLESVFHSALDTPGQVQPDRLVNLVAALDDLIGGWPRQS